MVRTSSVSFRGRRVEVGAGAGALDDSTRAGTADEAAGVQLVEEESAVGAADEAAVGALAGFAAAAASVGETTGSSRTTSTSPATGSLDGTDSVAPIEVSRARFGCVFRSRPLSLGTFLSIECFADLFLLYKKC